MKRNFILSGILSLLLPGLGQLYNGQLKKGIFIILINEVLAWGILPVFELQYNFTGLFIVFTFSILVHLYAIIDAIITSIRVTQYELKAYNKSYIYFSIIAVYILFSYFVDYDTYLGTKSYTIPGSSNAPTLLTGDFIISDINYYKTNLPKPGEMIIYNDSDNPDIPLIKRCVGVGGQVVEIRDKQLYVDNIRFDDSSYVQYIDKRIFPNNMGEPKVFQNLGSRDNFGPVKIPFGNYFVLGDNRDNSFDSRFSGFISKENIFGKPLFVYFSWDKGSTSIFNRTRFIRIGLRIK